MDDELKQLAEITSTEIGVLWARVFYLEHAVGAILRQLEQHGITTASEVEAQVRESIKRFVEAAQIRLISEPNNETLKLFVDGMKRDKLIQ